MNDSHISTKFAREFTEEWNRIRSAFPKRKTKPVWKGHDITVEFARWFAEEWDEIREKLGAEMEGDDDQSV